MRLDIGDGWSLDLPAEMQAGREDDGSFVAWDERHTLRASTIATSGREGGTSIAAREMIGTPGGEVTDGPGGIVVDVGESFDEVEDGVAMRTRNVRVGAVNHLLVLSFFTLEGDERWVDDAVATLRHDAP